MGFFSWDCKGCEHSIREGKGWMAKAVVQGRDGDTASGSYDGYGRLSGSTGTTELTDMDGSFALFHKKCYSILGQPEYSGPSRSARDQGMPPADEFPEPRNADDLRALKELAREAHRKEAEKDARRQACWEAERKLLGAAAKCPHCPFDHFFVVEKQGVLMIRCPNRDCKKLRPFPAALTEAWRALAAEYSEQPVIWDDRKVGPHFSEVQSLESQIKSYSEEFDEIRSRGGGDDEYVLKRLEALRSELSVATVKAEASEAAEAL